MSAAAVARAAVDALMVRIASGHGYTLQAEGWTVYHTGQTPTEDEVRACLGEHASGNPDFFARLKEVNVEAGSTKPIKHRPAGYRFAQFQSELNLYTGA